MSQPSTSSRLNVEQCTSLTSDGYLHHGTSGRATIDQESTTSTKEILEIRTCIAEILAKSQSEVATGNSGAWGRSNDLSFGDEPLNIASVAHNELDANSFLSTPPNLGHSLLPQPLLFLNGQPSTQEYGSLAPPSVGVGNTLPKGTDPTVYQVSQRKFKAPLVPSAMSLVHSHSRNSYLKMTHVQRSRLYLALQSDTTIGSISP